MAGPTHKQLSDKVDELQTALDLEQQQVKDAFDARDAAIAEKQTLLDAANAHITTLDGIIADLQAQVADGGSPEERQATLDKVLALKADVESTITDAPPPPPPVE